MRHASGRREESASANRRSAQRRLFPQNDLRVHFGIGKAENVELLEIRWPSGLVETLKDIKPNQLIFVKEGEGITRTMPFDPPKAKKP
jgi:hypothetical protein